MKHRSLFGLLLCALGCLLFPKTAAAQAAGTVRITFTNTSKIKLTLNSGAPGQPLQNIAPLDPGKTTTVQSYPGQNWVLLNPANRVFGEYRATQQARQAFTFTYTAPVPGAKGGTPQPVPVPVPQPPVAQPVAGATGSRVTSQQATQMVNYHNQKRAEVGSDNVRWSAQIAQYAQGRADTIARTKKLAHLPQGNPYGENLAQGGSSGAPSGFTVVSACDGWYAEKAKMPKADTRVFTVPLFNLGVGHYTQMVWKGSTEIGAGIAQYQQGGFTWTVIVCCYNPPGNQIGAAIY